MVLLAHKLPPRATSAHAQLSQVVLVFKPETLLKWHRELVRRTWTFTKAARRGRPPTSPGIEALIVQMAKENPAWGYGKLEGEPGALRAKLGYQIGRSTIRDMVQRHHVPPAPERGTHGRNWRTFLAH